MRRSLPQLSGVMKLEEAPLQKYTEGPTGPETSQEVSGHGLPPMHSVPGVQGPHTLGLILGHWYKADHRTAFYVDSSVGYCFCHREPYVIEVHEIQS